MPSSFTPTPALPHQGGGRKNRQLFLKSWDAALVSEITNGNFGKTRQYFDIAGASLPGQK
jgi:hypothetical protein